MEFTHMLRKRRMTRGFEDRDVDPQLVERILAAGLRGPTAGHTQAVDLLVLQGPVQTGRYWDAALPAGDRRGFPWPGLLSAALLVVVLSSEGAYRRRYAEADKAPSAFDVPWWHVDAAFAALLLQLAAVDAGLGALFFATHHVPTVRQTFGVPDEWAPVGTVAIGHPAPDRPSSSVVTRSRRPAAEAIHRGAW
ncbi:MAG TPA: nitroreductase family protein [Acidimicrobiales bacterium]|nr:nitroreductase family protein [Acidimicrobiales bacterium]